jgi:excisionase family DNA binding protein
MSALTVRGEVLPPTLTTDQAAELLGTTAETLYRLVQAGQAPVEPLRLGRVLRWPTALVLEVLGLAPTRDEGPATTPGPRPIALIASPGTGGASSVA